MQGVRVYWPLNTIFFLFFWPCASPRSQGKAALNHYHRLEGMESFIFTHSTAEHVATSRRGVGRRVCHVLGRPRRGGPARVTHDGTAGQCTARRPTLLGARHRDVNSVHTILRRGERERIISLYIIVNKAVRSTIIVLRSWYPLISEVQRV